MRNEKLSTVYRGVVQTSHAGGHQLLPLPTPFLSPSLFLPPSLSAPPLSLEVGPLIVVGDLGKRFSSPSGSGRGPAANRYLVNFRLKISPLVATIFRSFSGNEKSNQWSVNTVGYNKTAIQYECTVSRGLFSQFLHSKFCTEWRCQLPFCKLLTTLVQYCLEDSLNGTTPLTA